MDRRSLPPWLWPQTAYVHVPFCAHHCGYCDFAVTAGQDQQIEDYLEALAVELSQLGQPEPVKTIFLGGGTPTHLDPRQLARLLAVIRRWLPLRPNNEFSVEANPGTLDDEKIAVLAEYGVNRLSVGAQSFQPHLLRFLERQHQPHEVFRAVESAKRSIAQVSLDLIFGVPGQTLIDWHADLRQALFLEPDHLSTYGLTYETGTRLWKQRQRGEVRPLEEEQELTLYSHAIDVLEEAGFEHYEISSFALPGCCCRHNQVYWANQAYFGFGMGAARYIHGRRELNTRNLQCYLSRIRTGQAATFQSETLEPEQRARETLALQLRRSEGIHRPRFREQTGWDLDALAGPALARHTEQRLLLDDGVSVRLSRRGKYVADALIETLL
jgi:oxygen-independent coproporphyrinogen-3 oxidase